MAEKDLQKRLGDMLSNFRQSVPGVVGAAIINVDGFAIA